MKLSTQCRHLPLCLGVVAVVGALAVAFLPFCFAVDYENGVVANEPGGFASHSANLPPAATKEFLRIHNEARAAVGVAPLKSSPLLCTLSSDYCVSLSKNGKFEHDPKTPFGENLFWASGSSTDSNGVVTDQVFTGADAANDWLSEKKDYVYGPMGANSGKTGHYTQMVWANTTYVGFFYVKDSKGRTVIVARYGPRGNITGEYQYPQK